MLLKEVPSEEEIVGVMKTIYSFQQKHPDLLIGLMGFPDCRYPSFFLIQYNDFLYLTISYYLRLKRMSIEAINSRFHLLDSEFFCEFF